jgi:2-polyprenyl-3-methyl-5-hydroxy-6-metoxy-1,4-benzoquinol methylase
MKLKNAQTNWDSYYEKHVSLAHKEALVKQWKAHSSFYIQWLRYIDNRVPLYKKSLKMFEIGSGLGGVLAILAARGIRITGSDISKKAVVTGKMLNPHAGYRYFNIQTMTFAADSYDRIMAFEVLEHLDTLDRAISRIWRGLKKGGYFIGSTPYPYKKHVTAPTHIHVLYPQEWKELFYKNGFSQVHTYPMSLPPFLWRIHSTLNIIFPLYIPLPGWIATTLIIAKK